MPSIGRPFKREGVPRKDLALAALGVEVESEKGLEREREGAKGLGEIALSAEERESALEEESKWDRSDMIAWAKTIGEDEKYNEAWVDETFEFLPDGTIRSKGKGLDLTGTQVKQIPPGLQVDALGLSGTQVKEIPPGLQVNELYLSHTQVTEIPPGLQVKMLNLSGTQVQEIPPDLQVQNLYLNRTNVSMIPASLQVEMLTLQSTRVSEIPEGLQVQKLDLRGTKVSEIPENKGSIQKIWVESRQTALKASAESLGIDAVVIN